MLTFHVMVNVLVKWKNYVDVPENENQSVELMGRRTVTSVWQNVKMLKFHVTVNVLVKWKNYVDVPENGNQSVG